MEFASKRRALFEVRYEYVKNIGKGATGNANLVKNKQTGELFVAKEMKLVGVKDKDRKQAVNEVNTLSRLDHPHIVRYVDCFSDDEALCIVMEYAAGGDLWSNIVAQKRAKRHYSEEVILNWTVQLCSALHYLHYNNIMHRDLKARNVFLTENGSIKLGDFGMAKILADSSELKQQTLCGTPHYMPPEIAQNQPYNVKCDMWSLGCIVYELATLAHAFDTRPAHALMKKIINCEYQPIATHLYSEQLTYIISSLLCADPSKRLSTQELLEQPVLHGHLTSMASASTDFSEEEQEWYNSLLENPEESEDILSPLVKPTRHTSAFPFPANPSGSSSFPFPLA
eukprot:TRINITY_DN46178_c0_g1_i1.p2 TRINITY_DN46178_c0_g1~~TRINITY_DN46178_c0_g1_i1.p2  ORF type:complete len:340 (+),score=29.62 TRINITY_DN46178_c0_g1_i1:97-1116(+)